MSCTSDIVYRLYLQFFVGGRNVLFTLFVVASYSGVQHILICDFCFVCLRLMYSGVQHIVCCILCYVCLRLMYGGIHHILCCVFVLFVFVLCLVYGGVRHILCCVFVLFVFVLCLVYGGIHHILCCVFCFVCLRYMSCVPNVASFSVLYIAP